MIKTAIEEMRAMVRAFDNLSENFNDRYTLPELITIWRAWRACEWDYYPDQWSKDQIHAVLRLGVVPRFTDDGKPAPGRRSKCITVAAVGFTFP